MGADVPESGAATRAASGPGAQWTRAEERRILGVLLLLYVMKAALWMSVLPPWQGPDEIGHFDYVRRAGAGPIVDSAEGMWLSCEVVRTLIDPECRPVFSPALMHPPLYYHALGRVLPVMGTWDLTWQLRGLRLASTLLLGVTVLALFLALRPLDGAAPGIPLLAVAFATSLPMFALAAAVVNNDAMIALVGALYFWATARFINTGATAAEGILLGLILSWGLLTKASFVVFVPMVMVYYGCKLASAARSGGGVGRRTLGLGISALLALAVPAALAGWWYLGNLLRSGHPLWPLAGETLRRYSDLIVIERPVTLWTFVVEFDAFGEWFSRFWGVVLAGNEWVGVGWIVYPPGVVFVLGGLVTAAGLLSWWLRVPRLLRGGEGGAGLVAIHGWLSLAVFCAFYFAGLFRVAQDVGWAAGNQPRYVLPVLFGICMVYGGAFSWLSRGRQRAMLALIVFAGLVADVWYLFHVLVPRLYFESL